LYRFSLCWLHGSSIQFLLADGCTEAASTIPHYIYLLSCLSYTSTTRKFVLSLGYKRLKNYTDRKLITWLALCIYMHMMICRRLLAIFQLYRQNISLCFSVCGHPYRCSSFHACSCCMFWFSISTSHILMVRKIQYVSNFFSD
jgi:hypothetical protein